MNINIFKKAFGVVVFHKTSSPIKVAEHVNDEFVEYNFPKNWSVPLSEDKKLYITKTLAGSFTRKKDAMNAIKELKNKYPESSGLRFRICINPMSCKEFINSIHTKEYIQKANCMWWNCESAKFASAVRSYN